MITFLARVISLVLNPLVILLFIPLLFIYKVNGDLPEAIRWSVYSSFFVLLFVVFLWYGVKRKFFTNLDVSKREQRPLLFLVSICFAIVYLSGLYFFHAPLIMFLLIFSFIIGVFLASVLNMYLKTSLHVATISGLVVGVSVVYGGWFYLLLLLIPLVAWARLKLKRHTRSETIAGAILGSLLSLGMYTLVKVFFIK